MRQIAEIKNAGVEVWTDKFGNYTLKIGTRVAAVVSGDDTKRINELTNFLKGLEK